MGQAAVCNQKRGMVLTASGSSPFSDHDYHSCPGRQVVPPEKKGVWINAFLLPQI